MPEEARKVSAKDCEEVLKRVKDVITARMVLAGDGNISEVHVLASSDRAVKYIVRDVESSLIAAFGIPVDRRKISVAQIGSGCSVRSPARVQLQRVEMTSEPSLARVSVHLRMMKRDAVGSECGQPTKRGWLQIAARATSKALESYLPNEVTLDIQDVTIAPGRSSVAVVTVALDAFGQRQILSGSCLVAYDEREAVVRATLDAVNRRFAQIIDREG